MALANCNRCGKTLFSASRTCPSCGSDLDVPAGDYPKGPPGNCPECGGPVWQIKGLQDAREFTIFFVLFCLGLFPGLLYYMHVERIAYCLHCRRRLKHPQPG